MALGEPSSFLDELQFDPLKNDAVVSPTISKKKYAGHLYIFVILYEVVAFMWRRHEGWFIVFFNKIRQAKCSFGGM